MTTWIKNLNRIFYKRQRIGKTAFIRYAYSMDARTLENLKREQEKEIASLEFYKSMCKSVNDIREYYDGKIKETKKTLPVIDLFIKWESVHVHKDKHLNSICVAV